MAVLKIRVTNGQNGFFTEGCTNFEFASAHPFSFMQQVHSLVREVLPDAAETRITYVDEEGDACTLTEQTVVDALSNSEHGGEEMLPWTSDRELELRVRPEKPITTPLKMHPQPLSEPSRTVGEPVAAQPARSNVVDLGLDSLQQHEHALTAMAGGAGNDSKLWRRVAIDLLEIQEANVQPDQVAKEGEVLAPRATPTAGTAANGEDKPLLEVPLMNHMVDHVAKLQEELDRMESELGSVGQQPLATACPVVAHTFRRPGQHVFRVSAQASSPDLIADEEHQFGTAGSEPQEADAHTVQMEEQAWAANPAKQTEAEVCMHDNGDPALVPGDRACGTVASASGMVAHTFRKQPSLALLSAMEQQLAVVKGDLDELGEYFSATKREALDMAVQVRDVKQRLHEQTTIFGDEFAALEESATEANKSRDAFAEKYRLAEENRVDAVRYAKDLALREEAMRTQIAQAVEARAKEKARSEQESAKLEVMLTEANKSRKAEAEASAAREAMLRTELAGAEEARAEAIVAQEQARAAETVRVNEEFRTQTAGLVLAACSEKQQLLGRVREQEKITRDLHASHRRLKSQLTEAVDRAEGAEEAVEHLRAGRTWGPKMSAKVLGCTPLTLGIEAEEDGPARGDATEEFAGALESLGSRQAFRVGRVRLETGPAATAGARGGGALPESVPVCCTVTMANDGEECWPETAVLALAAGESLDLPVMPLGPLSPGELAQVELELRVTRAAEPGVASSTWAVRDAATGQPLGPILVFEAQWLP